MAPVPTYPSNLFTFSARPNGGHVGTTEISELEVHAKSEGFPGWAKMWMGRETIQVESGKTGTVLKFRCIQCQSKDGDVQLWKFVCTTNGNLTLIVFND
jgi:hypothetical protein